MPSFGKSCTGFHSPPRFGAPIEAEPRRAGSKRATRASSAGAITSTVRAGKGGSAAQASTHLAGTTGAGAFEPSVARTSTFGGGSVEDAAPPDGVDKAA